MKWLTRRRNDVAPNAVPLAEPVTVETPLEVMLAIKESAERAAQVRGRHYTEWLPTLDAYRRERRDEKALPLLAECAQAALAEALVEGSRGVASAYTERAAIILRRQKRLDDEVLLLEAWLDALPPGVDANGLDTRLTKARALLAKSPGGASK